MSQLLDDIGPMEVYGWTFMRVRQKVFVVRYCYVYFNSNYYFTELCCL